MSNIEHKTYGYFTDKFYSVPDCGCLMIPDNMNIKGKSVQVQLSDSSSTAEINMYNYYSDLTTTNNDERESNMEDFLVFNKIKEISEITNGYIIGVFFELYNKDGKLIKSGKSEVAADHMNAYIFDEIKKGNFLNYRKGMVFDGIISINVPVTACYGIQNAYSQYPYTLKINSLYLLSTIGNKKYTCDFGSQVNDNDVETQHCHHAYDSNYKCHRHDTICNRNFSSCFITNAKLGTTMIDHVVSSAKLEIPGEYTEVTMCTIPCESSEYTIKLNKKLDYINLNIEIFLDNFNVVYDNQDVLDILEENVNGSDVEEDPDAEEEPDDDQNDQDDSDDTEEDKKEPGEQEEPEIPEIKEEEKAPDGEI